MKKIISTLAAVVVSFSLLHQPQVQAASAIKIYINGVELKTDQPSIMSGSRVIVPLRGIFEAFGASLTYDATRTVTAKKDGITVSLKLDSRTATVNNQVVSLDEPARSIMGRTMVPLRFISEALGQKVDWQPSTQSVLITTSGNSDIVYPTYPGDTVNPGGSYGGSVASVTNLNALVTGQNGNGSDVLVNFTVPASQAYVSEYRIFAVREENAPYFNMTRSLSVNPSNYTVVRTSSSSQSVYLSSNARDVDGNPMSTGNSYKIFMLTVGANMSETALSLPSAAFSLNGNSVLSVSNISLSQVSNYGDGRDLGISFTRAQNESNISEYRVFIAKTKDAASFNLAAANTASSLNYISLGKAGSTSTLSTALNSSFKDTSGDYIRSGVAYTAFVMSVSNNPYTLSSKLSTGSASMMLGTSSSLAPVINWTSALNNYGDSRDLQLSFTKPADESKVSYYRVFVVRESNASSFDLNTANSVTSGRYYDVSKGTSGSTTISLPSNLMDAQGFGITRGVAYRMFVMAVSNSSFYPNVLSAPSTSLVLSTSGNLSAISNLTVGDTNDYGDGRDLQVSFTRASDESNISQYRIFVVKASNANNFDLNTANSLSSSYYTYAATNGRNQILNLSQSALTTDGSRIVNGVSYRVFVLSVAQNGYSSSNVLSSASSAITLTDNSSIGAVSNLNVSTVANNNNASDLRVNFSKATNESNISGYRIMVVKDSEAGSFDLNKANNVTSSYFKQVSKTGGNIDVTLDSWLRTVSGEAITNGIPYRVFVLSVGTAGNSVLSAPSSPITLNSGLSISPVRSMTTFLTADSKISVGFTKSDSENLISEYRIIAVPADRGSLTLSAANAVVGSGYTSTGKEGSTINRIITTDITGSPLRAGMSYTIYVLAVSNGAFNTPNVLSGPSSAVTVPYYWAY